MIDIAYVRKMSRYNRWQNANLYGAAGKLTDDARWLERGAFFGSIAKTFSHLIWADAMWLSRFGVGEKPAQTAREALEAHSDWDDLCATRESMDSKIESWADALDPKWLEGDLVWQSGITGKTMTEPKWTLVTHMFNHQTHHRGQVHCMLTQSGVKPNDTDLWMMPE